MFFAKKEINKNEKIKALIFFVSLTIFSIGSSAVFTTPIKYLFFFCFFIFALFGFKKKINYQYFVVNFSITLPLLLGSIFTPFPINSFYHTLGTFLYLQIIIITAYLIPNLIPKNNKVILLASRFHCFLLLFTLLAYYLKLPYSFIYERASARLTSIIFGDPNYTALAVLIICFIYSLLLNRTFKQNLLLNCLSIFIIILTGSVSTFLYFAFSLLVVYGFNAIKIFLDYLRKQKIKKFKIEKNLF